MTTKNAIVIGGGIGGLAAGLALHRAGWNIEILERSPEFSEVGLGLSLWPNAIRALDAIGIGDQVRGLATITGEAGVRSSDGRWLARTDVDEIERRYGPSIMMLRSALHRALRNALPEGALRSGVRVTDVHSSGVVVHSAGESLGDLVVGADGLRSTVRARLWPDAERPRYAGYTVWRFMSSAESIDGGAETWGRGQRFGYWSVPDGRTFCFAVVDAAEGADEAVDRVRSTFAEWHTPIPVLIETMDPATVLHHDIYDLAPLATFVSGKVVLLGPGFRS